VVSPLLTLQRDPVGGIAESTASAAVAVAANFSQRTSETQPGVLQPYAVAIDARGLNRRTR
jgi:hypothetical protein